MVDSARLIARLGILAKTLPVMVADVTEADARWKPPSGAWSILEIVNHLVDEEVLDFRARVQSTLKEPEAAWPEIDPEGWARTRCYNERDLTESVGRFVEERARSLAWLAGLGGQAPWSQAYQHPKVGPIRAGDLLASWAAHDALHLRQIAKRFYELSGRDGGEFRTRYAGTWGP
jgi:hypothetical protein